MKDIEKSIDYPLASRDSEGRLIVGGAVGVSKDLQQRAKLLVEAESTSLYLIAHMEILGELLRQLNC